MQTENNEVIHAQKVLPSGEITESHNLNDCCDFISELANKYEGMCNENHPIMYVKKKLREIRNAFRVKLDRCN